MERWTLTPNENDDINANAHKKKDQLLDPSTPSPQCVDEIIYQTSEDGIATMSDDRSSLIASKMLFVSDHFVTVNDDEVIISSNTFTLPELEETTASLMGRGDDASTEAIVMGNNTSLAKRDDDDVLRLIDDKHGLHNNNIMMGERMSTMPSPSSPISINTTSNAATSSSSSSSSPVESRILVQHKLLYQCVSSFASLMKTTHDQEQQQQPTLSSPHCLNVGLEREVLFHTDSLGIKLSRHTDGFVRVLSVTPYRAAVSTRNEKIRNNSSMKDDNNNQQQHKLQQQVEEEFRTGEIYAGDVVREVCGVDLRYPIDSAVWKMTVGLMKVAPRPLQFVVAEELLSEQNMDDNDNDDHQVEMSKLGNDRTKNVKLMSSMLSSGNRNNDMMDTSFGPIREVHFLESCLGVKLHHSTEGYVQILSVAPYKSFPNAPLARIGEVYAGDIVLQVGGVWDLREPIDGTTWSVLIKFIRETKRPMSMIVAAGDCIETVLPGGGEEEEEEEDERDDSGEVNHENPIEKEGLNEILSSEVLENNNRAVGE